MVEKNCQFIVKAKKVYEDCDCYLEYKNVIQGTYFISEYLKCG